MVRNSLQSNLLHTISIPSHSLLLSSLRSILFKIAKDVLIAQGHYLYGGKDPHDHSAMKAAAHELLGASHYYDFFDSINLPIIPTLQTIVDYKGFRIVALPLLPISKETIIYGSCDAGVTVHNEDPVAAELMKQAAIHLHLAEHLVRGKALWTAGDVEVHRARDGRMFLLDLARCFPPENVSFALQVAPDTSFRSTTVFHRMLRPEALMHWKAAGGEPLSPDALTGWGVEGHAQHVVNLLKATSHVLTVQVAVCRHLISWKGILKNIYISTEFHRFGLNMRNLFIVYKKILERLENLPLTWILFKNCLREK